MQTQLTGHAEIDRQHDVLRHLMQRIDSLDAVPVRELGAEVRRQRLSVLGHEILKALVGHQTYEDKLMELLPDLPACRAHVDRHRAAHAKLHEQLSALVARVPRHNPHRLAGEIRQMLNDWLPPHEADYDVPLGRQLARYSATELVFDRALVHLLDDHVFPGRPQLALAAEASPAPKDRAAAYARLTPRQKEVCSLLVAGHSAPRVAAILGLSVNTIKTHRSEIFRKMGANKLLDLARLTDSLRPPGGH